MTAAQLHEAKTWFGYNVGTFADDAGNLPPFLQLKAEHSKCVAANMRLMAEELGWISADVNIAEALGWLHDAGRFSQFAEFGTFTDATSVNHGERGWDCVRSSAILTELSPTGQAVLQAGIPKTTAENCIRCMACIQHCPNGARKFMLPKIHEIAPRLHATCQIRREPECFPALSNG